MTQCVSTSVDAVWRRSAAPWAAARRGVDVSVLRLSAQLVVRAKCHCFSWDDAGALSPFDSLIMVPLQTAPVPSITGHNWEFACRLGREISPIQGLSS